MIKDTTKYIKEGGHDFDVSLSNVYQVTNSIFTLKSNGKCKTEQMLLSRQIKNILTWFLHPSHYSCYSRKEKTYNILLECVECLCRNQQQHRARDNPQKVIPFICKTNIILGACLIITDESTTGVKWFLCMKKC